MKLSEKYLNQFDQPDSNKPLNKDRAIVYGQIIALEAQQTLLVSNPATFPQERYIDKLAEIVNKLEEIKIKEQL